MDRESSCLYKYVRRVYEYDDNGTRRWKAKCKPMQITPVNFTACGRGAENENAAPTSASARMQINQRGSAATMAVEKKRQRRGSDGQSKRRKKDWRVGK